MRAKKFVLGRKTATAQDEKQQRKEEEVENKTKLAAEIFSHHLTHRKHAPERRCPEANHRHLEARGPERAAREETRGSHLETRERFRSREDFSIVREKRPTPNRQTSTSKKKTASVAFSEEKAELFPSLFASSIDYVQMIQVLFN